MIQEIITQIYNKEVLTVIRRPMYSLVEGVSCFLYINLGINLILNENF